VTGTCGRCGAAMDHLDGGGPLCRYCAARGEPLGGWRQPGGPAASGRAMSGGEAWRSLVSPADRTLWPEDIRAIEAEYWRRWTRERLRSPSPAPPPPSVPLGPWAGAIEPVGVWRGRGYGRRHVN
jgi:hypothetical protein